MDYEALFRRIADMARPYCIYVLGTAIAIAIFVPRVDPVIFGLVLGAFGSLIAARSYENVVQTKTSATTAQGTATTTSSDSGKTQTVEVKAPAAVLTEPNKP